MELLQLGRIDASVKWTPQDAKTFFDRYHHPHGFRAGDLRFRDDSTNEWRDPDRGNGNEVAGLTRRLQAFGFMPHAAHDGIYGYVTQAAVRLFQEYVRSVEGLAIWPDGIVGPLTRAQLQRWEDKRLRSRWSTDQGPTPDYLRWMDWLSAARTHYTGSPTRSMQLLQGAIDRGDSLLPKGWVFRADRPQLVGLRHASDRPCPDDQKRPNDDGFVLLIAGRSFYFGGSTDPNPAVRAEAYLIEGQHRYRFNWHNIGSERRERIYKAARPAGRGVMVIRDVHRRNALTEDNLRDGFDPLPNPTINIHWSGLGHTNWSAGCQVIAGAGYVNDVGDYVDCTAFTARSDRRRGKRGKPDGPRMTMGAYTLLSDLMLCYTAAESAAEKPTFRYTLLPVEALNRVGGSFDPTPYFHKLNINS